jgi:hypothetical protein
MLVYVMDAVSLRPFFFFLSFFLSYLLSFPLSFPPPYLSLNFSLSLNLKHSLGLGLGLGLPLLQLATHIGLIALQDTLIPLIPLKIGI